MCSWSSSWSLPSSRGSSRPAAVFRQRALQELESRGLLQAQRTAGRTVTADDTALQALRRRRAGTLAAEFLHQMQALGLTEAEIETLLRETAQQAPKKE